MNLVIYNYWYLIQEKIVIYIFSHKLSSVFLSSFQEVFPFLSSGLSSFVNICFSVNIVIFFTCFLWYFCKVFCFGTDLHQNIYILRQQNMPFSLERYDDCMVPWILKIIHCCLNRKICYIPHDVIYFAKCAR